MRIPSGLLAATTAVATTALLTVGATEAAAQDCSAEYTRCVSMEVIDIHWERLCAEAWVRCMIDTVIAE